MAGYFTKGYVGLKWVALAARLAASHLANINLGYAPKECSKHSCPKKTSHNRGSDRTSHHDEGKERLECPRKKRNSKNKKELGVLKTFFQFVFKK
jgi:hypothetical protein